MNDQYDSHESRNGAKPPVNYLVFANKGSHLFTGEIRNMFCPRCGRIGILPSMEQCPHCDHVVRCHQCGED